MHIPAQDEIRGWEMQDTKKNNYKIKWFIQKSETSFRHGLKFPIISKCSLNRVAHKVWQQEGWTLFRQMWETNNFDYFGTMRDKICPKLNNYPYFI